MRIDRKVLKGAARESMRGLHPSARMVTLVFLLLTSVLTGVVQMFVSNPFSQVTSMVMQGYDPQWVVSYLMTGNGAVIYVFVTILLAIYASVMSFGYSAYCMRVSRGEESGYGTLFEGFSMVGRVILLNILVVVFSCLWALALSIPVAIIGGLAMAFAGGLGVVIFIILYIAMIVGLFYFILQYVLADYCLLDAPEAGCMAAIRTSKELMRGHKWEYFVLMLSFIGWVLLEIVLVLAGVGVGTLIGGAAAAEGGAVIDAGLGTLLGTLFAIPVELWLTPYQNCTIVNFYDALNGRNARTEDSWDSDPWSAGPDNGNRQGNDYPQL